MKTSQEPPGDFSPDPWPEFGLLPISELITGNRNKLNTIAYSHGARGLVVRSSFCHMGKGRFLNKSGLCQQERRREWILDSDQALALQSLSRYLC